MRIARYIIVLDRYDDDDYVAESATDEDAMQQVAHEFAYAMGETGGPAGYFKVVAREVCADLPEQQIVSVAPTLLVARNAADLLRRKLSQVTK